MPVCGSNVTDSYGRKEVTPTALKGLRTEAGAPLALRCRRNLPWSGSPAEVVLA